MASPSNRSLSKNIHLLIADGNTAEALMELFEAGFVDILPLKAQYDIGIHQLDTGLISATAWNLLTEQINQNILDMVQ